MRYRRACGTIAGSRPADLLRMTDRLASLYAPHLACVIERATHALARGGFDHLLVAAGAETWRFLDDNPYAFQVNPQFKAWLPLTAHPHCWIAFTPGKRPLLVYHQPADYWHLPPSAPQGHWVDHFDIRVVGSPAEARAQLPADVSRAAIIGEAHAALDGVVPNNPKQVLDSLHLARTRKTAYEIECMRQASLRAVRGHRAAAAVFRERGSEHQIHRAFCEAVEHTESELPYANIVALNRHGATLHYQHQERIAPSAHHALLIDAGAQVCGYAADITRTYGDAGAEFSALLEAVNHVQLQLVAQARPGTDYPQLHVAAHHLLAGVLHAHGIVRMGAESAVESGLSSVFFPHGLGHFLGLQVHDVAGLQRDEDGNTIARPVGHPYLRLTRVLEAGNVLTIEPGIYFIDMLLDGWRAGPHAREIDWTCIERLRRYGGIRIEDNVHVSAEGPENLTRDALRALALEATH
jgi:Xaa-Pro dipeptidase